MPDMLNLACDLSEARIATHRLCNVPCCNGLLCQVTCLACAMLSFLLKGRRDFWCMKYKLVGVLDEKILGLEVQISTLQRIWEKEDLLHYQIPKALSQMQEGERSAIRIETEDVDCWFVTKRKREPESILHH